MTAEVVASCFTILELNLTTDLSTGLHSIGHVASRYQLAMICSDLTRYDCSDLKLA